MGAIRRKESSMNLQATVKTNKRILALIESKYEKMPSLWAKNPETTYYYCLLRDTERAEAAIEHGGLAPIRDTGKG